MCRQVTCTRCGQPTWAGCGAHVEQVLRDVPPAERCRCKGPGAKHGVSGSKRTTPKKRTNTKAGSSSSASGSSSGAAGSEDGAKRRWWQR